MCGASLTQWIVLGVVEDWLCRGGRGGGVVAMVAVFGGDGRQVVGVGAVGAGVVVTVHPSGGGGLEVVAAPPVAAAPAARVGHPGPFCRVPRWPPGPPGIPPAPASKRLAPGGEDLLLDPGAAFDTISWRAGGTGRRESRGRGRSCTPTRSGRCAPGAGPAVPPLRSSMHSADQRQGRSHCAAMDTPTRSARSRPRPRPAARDAGSPVLRAPSPVVPGRLPATDPPRPEPTASAARSRAARRSRAALRFWRCERCWEAVTVSTVPVMCRDACWARARPPVPARRMTLSKQPGGRLAAGPQRLPGGPP